MATIAYLLEDTHFNWQFSWYTCLGVCFKNDFCLPYKVVHSFRSLFFFLIYLGASRHIFLPIATWRGCFDHSENVKVLHKYKVKRVHRDTDGIPLLGFFILVGMNLI